MDPADFQALQEVVGAFLHCLGQGAGPLEKLRVADEVLDFLRQRPVQGIPGLAEMWEGERVFLL